MHAKYLRTLTSPDRPDAAGQHQVVIGGIVKRAAAAAVQSFVSWHSAAARLVICLFVIIGTYTIYLNTKRSRFADCVNNYVHTSKLCASYFCFERSLTEN